jgi:tetratricopeptide (TPR) repeat protein
MYRMILRAPAALLFLAAVAAAAADDIATCLHSIDADGIAACSRLLRRDPKTVDAYLARGKIYAIQRDYGRAIADYNEAIKLNPKNALAYNARGGAYAARGDLDRAIADYDQALRLDPANRTLFYGSRGAAYEAKSDLDRAIADYDMASPGVAEDWCGGGRDDNFIIAGCTYRLNNAPKEASAYLSRGKAYERKGDFDHAIADYEAALKANPALVEARRSRENAQNALAGGQNAPRPTAPVVQAAAALPPSPPPSRPAIVAPGPASSLAAPERRVALVIGNSSYRAVPVLANPRRDAVAVADAVRQVGFQSVELAIDLDHDGMLKALRRFRDQADTADWALIYFAGHGIEIDRVNYLIPIDAVLHDDRDVKAETVSYDDLLTTVGNAKALRLIVLDACRNNPFKEHMHRNAGSRSTAARGLAAPPEAEPGTLVVYSAKEGEVAADDVDGVNSPFAQAFIAQLRVPGREVRRLFDLVRDDVIDATNKRQQPFTYGSLSGRRDFFFMAGR